MHRRTKATIGGRTNGYVPAIMEALGEDPRIESACFVVFTRARIMYNATAVDI